MPTPPRSRLALIAGLACAVALVCWPSSTIFAEKWADTVELGYTHGWLILVICIALVWRARAELFAAPARSSRWAFAALAAAMLAWLVCYRASIETLELPLVPVIFLLAVTAAFGWQVGRVLLFPAAYFCFAVPVWYPQPLRIVTVHVIHGMLRLTGPPAVFSGDVIRIPNGTFVIEDGCAGLHFMIVGLAVAALYGELERDSWRRRVKQLALMAALAAIANWIRVYTVIEAGYLTDMKSYLVRVSHYGFGWCVFAVALLLFLWLAPRLAPAAPRSPVRPPAAAPEYRPRAELLGCAGAILVIVIVPALNVLARAASGPATITAGLADPPAPWHVVAPATTSAWSPRFPGADLFQQSTLEDGAGRRVEVLTVAYRVQRDGAELVGESSSLSGTDLQPRAHRLIDTSAGIFRETEVEERTSARSLIWWRYEIAGRPLVVPVAEQLWFGLNALAWCPPASLIALRAACDSDCAIARRTLSELIASGAVH